MINLITDLTDEQIKEIEHRLPYLQNIAICNKCKALLQFEKRDISITNPPCICCPCGNFVKLLPKYKKDDK